jgi:hypothetical protein
MKDFLIEKGFTKSVNGGYAFTKGVDDGGDYYVLRIHNLIWLAYNLNDGFAELRRDTEKIGVRGRRVRICFPKPFKDKKSLKKLLEVLS